LRAPGERAIRQAQGRERIGHMARDHFAHVVNRGQVELARLALEKFQIPPQALSRRWKAFLRKTLPDPIEQKILGFHKRKRGSFLSLAEARTGGARK